MLISYLLDRQPAGGVSHKYSTVGWHYFLPGPRLPSQFQSVTALGRYQLGYTAWWTEARVWSTY